VVEDFASHIWKASYAGAYIAGWQVLIGFRFGAPSRKPASEGAAGPWNPPPAYREAQA